MDNWIIVILRAMSYKEREREREGTIVGDFLFIWSLFTNRILVIQTKCGKIKESLIKILIKLYLNLINSLPFEKPDSS